MRDLTDVDWKLLEKKAHHLGPICLRTTCSKRSPLHVVKTFLLLQMYQNAVQETITIKKKKTPYTRGSVV